tara:strand:+ start:127 stop:354 length:228 start_codon:yes stop_codon:yes gene_type:complete
MTNAEKIAFNTLLFVGIGVAVAIYEGTPFDPRHLFLLLLVAIPMGALLWLRWDWAPREGRRRRAERRRKREAHSE